LGNIYVKDLETTWYIHWRKVGRKWKENGLSKVIHIFLYSVFWTHCYKRSHVVHL